MVAADISPAASEEARRTYPHPIPSRGNPLLSRTHFIYGYEFPPSELAFSQPTPAGQMFASNYTGRGDFLVYIGAD